MKICKNIKKHPLNFIIKLIFFIGLAIWLFTVSYNYEEEQHKIVTNTSEKPRNIEFNKTYNIEPIEIGKIEDIFKQIWQKTYNYKLCFKDEGSKIKSGAFGGSQLKLLIKYGEGKKEMGVISNHINSLQEVCFKYKEPVDGYTVMFDIDKNNRIFSSFNQDGLREAFLKLEIIYYFRKSPSKFYHSLLSLFFSGIFLWSLTRIWKFLFYWGVG